MPTCLLLPQNCPCAVIQDVKNMLNARLFNIAHWFYVFGAHVICWDCNFCFLCNFIFNVVAIRIENSTNFLLKIGNKQFIGNKCDLIFLCCLALMYFIFMSWCFVFASFVCIYFKLISVLSVKNGPLFFFFKCFVCNGKCLAECLSKQMHCWWCARCTLYSVQCTMRTDPIYS